MNEAVAILTKAARFIRDQHINPLVWAIALALLAAWLEQKRVQGRTPHFTSDHQGEGSQTPRRRPR
jgi:hypothetical protein